MQQEEPDTRREWFFTLSGLIAFFSVWPFYSKARQKPRPFGWYIKYRNIKTDITDAQFIENTDEFHTIMSDYDATMLPADQAVKAMCEQLKSDDFEVTATTCYK